MIEWLWIELATKDLEEQATGGLNISPQSIIYPLCGEEVTFNAIKITGIKPRLSVSPHVSDSCAVLHGVFSLCVRRRLRGSANKLCVSIAAECHVLRSSSECLSNSAATAGVLFCGLVLINTGSLSQRQSEKQSECYTAFPVQQQNVTSGETVLKLSYLFFKKAFNFHLDCWRV